MLCLESCRHVAINNSVNKNQDCNTVIMVDCHKWMARSFGFTFQSSQ